MSSPTLKVEIAFASTPLNIAPTWVDVSVYVRRSPGVTIRRGRQSELDQFDAGSCTLTLSNRDRRFDPSNSAGPYFGNLTPRKQIRVTAVWSSVDYVMFTGHVTGWPQDFAAPAGKDATVTIEAVDALAWLANTNLPNDLVYSYAATTIGSLAFFLRGADTSPRWNDATSNGYHAGVRTGTAATGSDLAPGLGASTSLRFDGVTEWTIPQYQSAGPWSISWWMQMPRRATASFSTAVWGGGHYTTFNSGATVHVGGGLQVYVETTSDVGLNVSTTGVILDDNIPHHIVVCHDNSSTAANMRIYVDGVNRTGATGGIVSEPLTLDVFGNSSQGGTGDLLFTGSLQDVAVFTKQLSAAEVLAFYQRSYGSLEETSAARVTRLLDDVGWPATWRTITTTSDATVGELVYNGAPVLSKLQEIQRTEQGRVFASKSGNVTFLERHYAQEQTVGNTVQQIFSDDNGATALPFSTFQFQFNDIDVTNAATVTTPTTWASASDATSITANGLQSKKVDTILTTFIAADAMARGLVAQGKTATYRTAPILVYPENNTARWDEVLLLELGHRVSMEITPMTVGAQNAQEVTLEQIEWNIANTLWSLTVAGSPCFGGASGATAGWFVVGTSLVGGPDVIGY